MNTIVVKISENATYENIPMTASIKKCNKYISIILTLDFDYYDSGKLCLNTDNRTMTISRNKTA